MKQKTAYALKSYCSALFLLFTSLATFAQVEYYWVGGSGNWSDFENHWATTSGGTEFHTSVPSSVDDVYFDENSFTEEGQVVTLDITGFSSNRIHNLDWRGSTFSPSLVTQAGTSNYLRIHGSTYFHENMTIDVVQLSIQIYAAGDHAEFDPGGADLSNTKIFFLASANASLSVLDSISVESFDTASSIGGFITTNGHSIHVTEEFKINDSIVEGGKLDISNSKIYTKSFEINSTVAGELDVEGVAVEIIYPGGNTRMRAYDANPLILDYVIRKDHGISSVSSYEESSFDKLTLDPGVELTVWSSLDNGLEFNNLHALGTPEDRISILSEEEGELATLTSDADEVTFANVDFKDIGTAGESEFNAFRSNDLGNVSGINFLRLDQEIVFDLDLASFGVENIGDVVELTGSVDSELDITYIIDNADVAIISGSAELVLVGEGNTHLTVSQAGNEWYHPSEILTRLVRVGRLDQTIVLGEIQNQWIGNEFINISASADSGLPLTYNVTGPASLNGQTLEFTGAGTVQVTASQPGNDAYKAAESVMQVFEIFKESQTITFPEINDTSEDAGFVNLEATSTSGLPIVYSVVGPVEEIGGVLEFNGSGMVQVTATQSGNDLYAAAEEVKRTFEIESAVTEKPLSFSQHEGLASVYPNPVSNYLYFNKQLVIQSVRIHDLIGKEHFNGRLDGDFIDVSSYSKGEYIVTLGLSDGTVLSNRIRIN